jgi:hypothetical protein
LLPPLAVIWKIASSLTLGLLPQGARIRACNHRELVDGRSDLRTEGDKKTPISMSVAGNGMKEIWWSV